MAVINVKANIDGAEYTLDDQGKDIWTNNVSAPQKSTTVYVTARDEHGNTAQLSAELDVNLEWLPPKTDWTVSDFFNYWDYNRIINNLRYLMQLASKMYFDVTKSDLGKEKTVKSLIFAREFNAIEEALETLNNETYGFNIGETQAFKENRETVLWTELNRIESTTLLIYKTLKAQYEALPRLAFVLGQKGVIK